MSWYQDDSRRFLGAMLRRVLRRVLWLAALVLVGQWSGPGVAMAQHSVAAPALVFDGVTVIDVASGKRLPTQRVVVVGTRITAMGNINKIPLPAGAQVVDARGKYLIPGLWDIHIHPGRSIDLFYPLLIANGVTGMRDAGSPVPLDTLMMWRREILAGTRVGPPRQILSGPSIAGPLAGCRRGPREADLSTCVTDSADARHFVDSLKAAGADMIKPRHLTREMYFVIAAEARRIGIPFGGHAEQETPIEASDSGARIVDHVMDSNGLMAFGRCWAADKSVSVTTCQPVAEHFKHNDTWFAPTLMFYFGFKPMGPAATVIYKRLLARAHEFWAGSLLHGNWLYDSTRANDAASVPRPDSVGNLRIMARVGLPIVAGTDSEREELGDETPAGFALLAEMVMYEREGLTPLAALQTATLNPAKLLHATDSLGTVAPGKLADLVLLDADPLTDITNVTTIRAVVANGRYFDRTALDHLLIEVRAKANADAQPSGTTR